MIHKTHWGEENTKSCHNSLLMLTCRLAVWCVVVVIISVVQNTDQLHSITGCVIWEQVSCNNSWLHAELSWQITGLPCQLNTTRDPPNSSAPHLSWGNITHITLTLYNIYHGAGWRDNLILAEANYWLEFFQFLRLQICSAIHECCIHFISIWPYATYQWFNLQVFSPPFF